MRPEADRVLFPAHLELVQPATGTLCGGNRWSSPRYQAATDLHRNHGGTLAARRRRRCTPSPPHDPTPLGAGSSRGSTRAAAGVRGDPGAERRVRRRQSGRDKVVHRPPRHQVRLRCCARPISNRSLTPRPAPCTQLARPRARALRAVQRPGGGRQAAALGAVRAAQRQLARRLRQLHHERRAEPRRRQGGLLRDTLAQRLVRNQLLLVVP